MLNDSSKASTVALKSHLFAPSTANEGDLSERQAQYFSHLAHDYGRSLRPNIMATDAFYCLTEVLSFAASSLMEFLNLIDTKIDMYTSQPPEKEYQSLPNLKYTKQILYRYIQKTQRVLDSIENAKIPRWPKASDGCTDPANPGKAQGPAHVASKSLVQDFKHLLSYSSALHKRTTEAITDLRASISISESRKSMVQAERLGRLTFLAFIFVPLSFTTSFFGMNVIQLEHGRLGMEWWAVLTVFVTGAAVALFFIDFHSLARRSWRKLRQTLRLSASSRVNSGIKTAPTR